MGKLGKNARKFAKKNLQSVLKKNRKTKIVFKKRTPKGRQNDVEEEVDNSTGPPNVRSIESESIENTSLDSVFIEENKDEFADVSDSDGYLSEDSTYPYDVESETRTVLECEIAGDNYLVENKKIYADLANQKKKLDRLRKKDPEFSKFLETYSTSTESIQNEEYSDEDDMIEQGEDNMAKENSKLLTNNIINTLCQMIKEDNNNQSSLTSLVNAYRSACHYGAGSIGHKIENTETFCNILISTLTNADDIFRGILKIPSSNCKKEMILEQKNTSKWKSLKPLIKSYLRSTMFLLNQVTDPETLAFAVTRNRDSLLFFAAFPSLIQRLIETTVHLWATGGGVLSSASFLIIRDVIVIFGSKYFNTCLSKTFIAFMSYSRTSVIGDVKHMRFLRDSIVELCSLDVQKSSLKALASIGQVAKILRWGMETKKKEAIRRILSWEYINCIDLWVQFISANIRDCDLQSSFFITVQVINGLARMFSGPRYFPIKLKCIEWLNKLSSSSGTFIPIASLVLDMLEYKVVKEGGKAQNGCNIESILKLPKQYLKLRSFQEECFHSAIEQLSLHFAQWSFHISFPDLAAIPIIRLRKFHETISIESLRRTVKRLIEQVEQNVEFVQKKRDNVSFSPHDHQSVESFLQHEKSSLNASYTQYYKSVLDKAAERSLNKLAKISSTKQRNLKRNRAEHNRKSLAANPKVDADKDHPLAENGVLKPETIAVEVLSGEEVPFSSHH